MSFFIAVGVVALTVGSLFILAPETLRKLNEAGTRIAADLDSTAFSHRIGVGLSLVISSLLFFFVAWYIALRG